jgi:arylsulfatase A-like enzyme
MDAQLGRFFDWLASRDQLDSTVIALTSDHGERLGEQRRLGHQLGVDHVLLHVPLILRHPPSLAPSRINDLVHTHGLYRTLLRIAHVDAENPDPSPIEPLSAQQTRHTVALMRHQGKYIHTLYEVNKSFDPRPYAGHRMTAFDGRWKLTRSTAGFIHLYDIEQDPGEENDLSSRHSEVVDTLTPVLDRLPAFDRGSRTEDIPEDTRQLLEALGYVE